MFIVEGNIGAGKTTFLKLIATHYPHISVLFEPLKNWQSDNSNESLLAHFYKDPKRWAYTMETLAMASRVQDHIRHQNNQNPMQILERSIYSGHYCFAKNGYDSGYFTDLEWNVYLQWFDFLVNGHCKAPHGFIYLHVDPKVAYDRIKKRNRKGEETIPLLYLEQIHECHESFLIRKEGVLNTIKNTPVLTINFNEDIEVHPEAFFACVEQLESFMLTHTPTKEKNKSVVSNDTTDLNSKRLG